MFKKIINFFNKQKRCDHIFVYGTLRREFVYMNPMSNKLAKSSVFINNATLFNYGFCIVRDSLGAPLYPIAVKAEYHVLNGQIYRLKKHSNIIEQLDMYEGDLYTRKVLTINDLKCYVYLINEDFTEHTMLGEVRNMLKEIKSGNWLDYQKWTIEYVDISN